MRAALALAGAALLAACAASPPPPVYISGPIVPDNQFAERAHPSWGRNLIAPPAAPTPPGIADQLDDIEQQLRTLRDQLAPTPAAGP